MGLTALATGRLTPVSPDNVLLLSGSVSSLYLLTVMSFERPSAGLQAKTRPVAISVKVIVKGPDWSQLCESADSTRSDIIAQLQTFCDVAQNARDKGDHILEWH
jgi:hypothetical protein